MPGDETCPGTGAGNETDPETEIGHALELLRRPGKGGKKTENPTANHTVLPYLMVLEVDLVHGTEITEIDMQGREVAL